MESPSRRLLTLLRDERLVLAAVGVMALVVAVLGALGPQLLGHATDTVVDGARRGRLDYTALGHILAIVVAVYAVSAGVQWAQGQVLAGVLQRTSVRLRAEVEDAVHGLPIETLDRRPRGDLLSRVTTDVEKIGEGLRQVFGVLVTSVFGVLVIVVTMLVVCWQLALVVLITVPVGLVVAGVAGHRANERFQEVGQQTGDLTAVAEEAISGHAVLVAFGLQDAEAERFSLASLSLGEVGARAQYAAGMIPAIMFVVGNLTYVLVAIVGALRITTGSLSVGEVQAFLQYTRLFAIPLAQIAAVVSIVHPALVSTQRVFEVLDEERDRDPERVGIPPSPPVSPVDRGRVVFDDVSFSYDPDRPVLSHVSLDLAPGTMTAIVGETGAGKTTLVNLLLRFYDPDAGRILVEGIDIGDQPRADARRRFGVVLQDAWTFQGTIADNIRFGRLEASDEDVVAAARAAQLDHVVEALPESWGTILGESHSGLSTGECQLIMIARAFLADPPILVLDEATSAVDSRTDVLVQRALDGLREGRSTFVIAHRLSTIRAADAIVVMSEGRVAEVGQHDELLERDRLYAALYRARTMAPDDTH